MQPMEEILFNVNELNKFIQATYDEERQHTLDETTISKEEAWNYLIRAEQLLNSLNEEEDETSQVSNHVLNQQAISDNKMEHEYLIRIYEKYQMNLNETKSELVGLTQLDTYLNDLFRNFIENYFNFQFLFPEKSKQTFTTKIQNTLIYGLEGTGMMSLITNILIKYQSLFNKNSELPLLKVFKLDMTEILSTKNRDEIELIFKSINLFNKNKQPVVIILLNLEKLFTNSDIHFHYIGDLLYECLSKSNRLFIAVCHSPWLLHPAIIYRFQASFYCSELSRHDLKLTIESHMRKFAQNLNLTDDLVDLAEPYILNGKLIDLMFEKLKPFLAKTGNKTWKRIKTELDVLKRFNRLKMLKFSGFSQQGEDLKKTREVCLAEAKLFLESNIIQKEFCNKYKIFKNEYRSQFDFP